MHLPQQRIALGIAYDGRSFCGWQTQPGGRTVQDTLEAALSQLANHPVHTVCAGRTDTGVHGLGQVVHLDTHAQRRPESWLRGVNALLPPSIRVRWAQPVAKDFHARFSATGRHYVYILRNERSLAPSWVGRAGWDFHPLSLAAMQQAASYLIGEHDFSAFRASSCQAHTPVRELTQLRIEQSGVFIAFSLSANAFLHHMVRNIVGALLYVGKGKHSPEWMTTLLRQRDRRFSAPTFMPDGLYLSGVDYPAHFSLPTLAVPQGLTQVLQAL